MENFCLITLGVFMCMLNFFLKFQIGSLSYVLALVVDGCNGYVFYFKLNPKKSAKFKVVDTAANWLLMLLTLGCFFEINLETFERLQAI